MVFSGHDHIYERLKPQKGIHYFVVGAGGRRDTGIRPSDASAAAFDGDRSFLAVEVSGDKPTFFIDRLAQGIATIAAAFYPKAVIVRLSDFKTNEYARLAGGAGSSRPRRTR